MKHYKFIHYLHANLLFISLFFASIVCKAQSVSIDEAEYIALKYANHNCKSGEKQIVKMENVTFFGKASLYLAHLDDGWVLISSERVATPILAASQEGSFPTIDEMPEGMLWLMSYYENALQYARDSLHEYTEDKEWKRWLNDDTKVLSSNTSRTEKILYRMAEVKWGQSYNNDIDCVKPYNYYCPTWVQPLCNHAYAGCSAVAMGQVMWYFQWPHSAVVPACMNDSNGNVCGAVRLAEYNWDIIPTAIYSNTPWAQVKETAAFLRDCGYACHMKYRHNGSSASLGDVMDAMEDMFHYQSMHHRWRSWYVGNWTNKLKSELDAGRPIIYRGAYNGEGHAFVIYGYTYNNLFKINWGYRGTGNYGEYSLDALNPDSIFNGPFNDDQAALWGIYPEFPYCTSVNFDADDVSDNPFEIYGGSVVTSANTTINSGKSGLVYAGQSIQLSPPFVIQNGANIHLAIRNMHCIASTMNNQSGLSIEETDSITDEEPERYNLPAASLETVPSEENIPPTNTDAVPYNVLGQPVDENYKGIVIQNGKKKVQ